MPRFMVERDWPNVGMLPAEELRSLARQSCLVISRMPAGVYWVHSYVTRHCLYCIYIAPDEAAIYEHASFGGFAASRIRQISRIIDPLTAEEDAPVLL